MEATVDGRTQTAGPGSVFFFAANAVTRLRNAGDPRDAQRIAASVERVLVQSDSDTANLLMQRAAVSMQARQYPLALSLFEVPAEPALAFAIIVHAFQLISVLVLAGVAALWQGVSIRSLTGFGNTRP